MRSDIFDFFGRQVFNNIFDCCLKIIFMFPSPIFLSLLINKLARPALGDILFDLIDLIFDLKFRVVFLDLFY